MAIREFGDGLMNLLFRRQTDLLFKRPPISVVDGIPVFSERDSYIANYERIARDHIAAMKTGCENPFMDRELWRTLEDSTRAIIKKHVTTGARVLDIGVGLGRLLEPLSEYDRHGIDISLEYLRHAQAAGIQVAFARVEDMPYEDACFDAAICCDVLEHVLNLYSSSEQILRVLKPGGLLIARVPFKEELEGYLDPSNPYEFVHLRNFDVESLRLHFEKVFLCKWIEHDFAAPYFVNQARLRLRAIPAVNPLHNTLRGIPRLGHPLSPLKTICDVTEEELHAWLRSIQQQSPEIFSMIAEDLLLPLVVNFVVQKPLVDDVRDRAPRHQD
jgi:SAM-dependent methyltransferase